MLVVTAGCSGVTPQSTDDATTNDPTGTETPTTATTATETTTGGEVAAEVLPGLTEDGDLDAAALSGAHGDGLADESLTLDSARVERYANGTVRSERNQTIRTAANRTRYRILLNTTRPSWVAGADGEGELWANGTHVFPARATNGTMEYDRRIGPDSEPVEPRDYLRGDLTNSDRLLVLFTAFENESAERVRFSNVGETTVERPEWYDVAANRME